MGQRRILFLCPSFCRLLVRWQGLVPYILIWLIVKELLVPETTCNTDMMVYAWWGSWFGRGRCFTLFCCIDGFTSGCFSCGKQYPGVMR